MEVKERKFFDINGTIARQTLKTNKNGKPYWVLRIATEKYGSFFTTTFEDLREDLTGLETKLVIITDKIGFWDFMRGFYAPSFKISLLPSMIAAEKNGAYDGA
ncbi:MAG: hypothetical protein LBQ52_07100, partial [Helicobacteraceae bacterium]|nr:hypothetical protein [Helicobacteraceae bacterium]